MIRSEQQKMNFVFYKNMIVISCNIFFIYIVYFLFMQFSMTSDESSHWQTKDFPWIINFDILQQEMFFGLSDS